MINNEDFWNEYMLSLDEKQERMIRFLVSRNLCQYIKKSDIKHVAVILNNLFREATDVALCKP